MGKILEENLQPETLSPEALEPEATDSTASKGEEATAIIQGTRQTIAPTLGEEPLTQKRIDELSATIEGQKELLRIIRSSNMEISKRKALIFAITDLKTLLSGSHGEDRQLSALFRAQLKAHGKLTISSEPCIGSDMHFVIGIPIDAINTEWSSAGWNGQIVGSDGLKGDIRYSMAVGDRYKYPELVLATDILPRITGGRRFVSERSCLMNYDSSRNPEERDPYDEHVYLAGGYVRITKSDDGTQTATFRLHGTHYFDACHRVIIEKFKPEIMRSLGVSKIDFQDDLG